MWGRFLIMLFLCFVFFGQSNVNAAETVVLSHTLSYLIRLVKMA